MPFPRVLALIVNWNGAEVLEKTVRSLQESLFSHLAILVIDNASEDGSAEEVRRRHPEVEVLRLPENRGFAGGHNAGLRRAMQQDFDYALLLNNDVTLDAEALPRLVEAAEAHPEAGIIAPGVWCADPPSYLDCAWGQILYHHVIVRTLGARRVPKAAYLKERTVDCVFGSAMLLRCRILPGTGLFDERFWMFLEEVEFCRRVWKMGHHVLYLPSARAVHLGGYSIKKASAARLKIYLVRRNSILFMRRHGSVVHWGFFLVCVAASLTASLFLCAVQGKLPLLKARWEGYRDGFQNRFPPPAVLFEKYTPI
jgi:GT2 family glycosyltransferase